MHQLKYRGWRALAGPLAARMADLALPRSVEAEARVVVPVPTTPTRRRERGYNQAEALAQGFAQRTGREVELALCRWDRAGSQTSLQPVARRTNVTGMFAPEPDAVTRIRGAHVLLIDDVLTTGATAGECARTLCDAGVRCVSLVTFARALDARRFT